VKRMGRPSQSSIWESQRLDPDAVRLQGRAAVVSGAASGIGAASALALARFGADVALCDRNAAGLADVAVALEALGQRAVTAELDVRDPEAVLGFARQVEAELGGVDILVNNAGGGFAAAFLEVNEKGENALVQENFGSVTRMTRAFVPLLREGASIINITSVEAHRAGPLFAIYSAMKAAVTNLSMSLSMELAPRAIRVNCIAPDMIPTPGDRGLEEVAGTTGLPVQRHSWPERGHVDDCAAAVVFLAGDLSRFITGSTLHVDGGTWAAGGWKTRDDGGFTL